MLLSKTVIVSVKKTPDATRPAPCSATWAKASSFRSILTGPKLLFSTFWMRDVT